MDPKNAYDRNRRAYDKIARDYHNKRLNQKGGAWNDCLEVPAMAAMLKDQVRGKKVLDLGAGTGLLTANLSTWGADVVGVEPAPEMVKIAKQEFPHIFFHEGDAEAIPFPDQGFDLVASSLVMHYLKDLSKAFCEVARALKPGGIFVFSMHHPLQECYFREKAADEPSGERVILQPYFANRVYTWKLCEEEVTCFHHTFQEIFSALKMAGFTLQDLVECKPDPKLQNSFVGYEFTSQYPTFMVIRAEKI